jgi:hypothetical protein
LFAGIGLKLRIEVGGRVVDVRIGRLVERVWVLVVGCVLVLTDACVVSDCVAFGAAAVEEDVVELADGGAIFAFIGTEILAFMK